MKGSGQIIGFLVMLYLVYIVLSVFGCITMMIAITHSQKKRVVKGEDYSAGNVFAWYLGWGCASGYSLGIATIVYFLVKRKEIQETKERHGQTLAGIRAMNTQQAPQQ